ncbi:hypothetical protein [Legionella worsleiensis]|uniref:Uncharacterized protein n=1 Tax=Legionella worsleiensis TaxID=45076 RepID=A0A0W1AH79_9GAMM|nr:hypothetical protein [Legionella worsleiensis]KTD80717.1 hypothetical protein Lwor_0960 [Legionella worsleiensis]STY32705.1 Uncharacterised protein [Legionella worsleiensis]
MYLTYHTLDGKSYHIGIQQEWNQPTYYYPAVSIAVDGVDFQLYPTIADFDKLDGLPKLGLFKPKTPKAGHALFKHNLKHYTHSSKVKQLIAKNPHFFVPSQEQMAKEIAYMSDNGIAFNEKVCTTVTVNL